LHNSSFSYMLRMDTNGLFIYSFFDLLNNQFQVGNGCHLCVAPHVGEISILVEPPRLLIGTIMETCKKNLQKATLLGHVDPLKTHFPLFSSLLIVVYWFDEYDVWCIEPMNFQVITCIAKWNMGYGGMRRK